IAVAAAVARSPEGLRSRCAPSVFYPRGRGALPDAVGSVPTDADAGGAARVAFVRKTSPAIASHGRGTAAAVDREGGPRPDRTGSGRDTPRQGRATADGIDQSAFRVALADSPAVALPRAPSGHRRLHLCG